MPTIDPRVEEPTRDMLGHAIRGEMQGLAALIQSASEQYRQVLGLCLIAAAYVAVDVSGRWPTDADVREIARVVAERETQVQLDQADVYGYLSGAALGFKSLPEALGGDVAAATLPVLITGSMLFTFKPRGQEWWDYLDQIWHAYETADSVDASVLPALQVRVRMLKAVQDHEPGPPASDAWRLSSAERSGLPMPAHGLVTGYLSPATNSCHAEALKASVPPSRLVVSRTRITPSLPTSTHAPPLLLLYDDLRQSTVSLPSG